METHWNVGKLSKQVTPLKPETQSLLRMRCAWKFKSTVTRSDSCHFNCWPAAGLYALSKYQVMPLHIAHMKEGLTVLHIPQPNLHISMDSLCLSWHVTGAGVVRTELEAQWLFIHLIQSLQGDCSNSPLTLGILAQTKREGKQAPLQLLVCSIYTVLLTQRYIPLGI